MRKLVLAAALAALAVVVAPIATASADKLEGTCRVEGKATFNHELGFGKNILIPTTYSFKKSKVEAEDKPENTEAECEGKASGAGKETTPVDNNPAHWEVKLAEVTG